jgi:hypothetical protein
MVSCLSDNDQIYEPDHRLTEGYDQAQESVAVQYVDQALNWLKKSDYLASVNAGIRAERWTFQITEAGRQWHRDTEPTLGAEWREASTVSKSSLQISDGSKLVPVPTGSEAETVRPEMRTLGIAPFAGALADQDLVNFLSYVVLTKQLGPRDDYEFTYTSLLAGLLLYEDPICAWLQKFAVTEQVRVDAILGDGMMRRSDARPIKSASRSQPRWTSSAQNLLANAARLAVRTNSELPSVFGIRHLIAAYIYFPLSHQPELKKWAIDRQKLGTAYLDWSHNFYPAEDEAWRLLQQETFSEAPSRKGAAVSEAATTSQASGPEATEPTNQPAAATVPDALGPSTHVARDRWTVNDSLGYFPYAYAIYRFLTNKDTAPPLAISIQAPWGGGKTSLMKMIQSQLDPGHPGLGDSEADAPAENGPRAAVAQIWRELNGKTEALSLQQQGQRTTVWFNAWKYESTNQIWAGLADAIVKQIGERLPTAQRELFFFRLHLRRIDPSRIRRRLINDFIDFSLFSVARNLWLYMIVPTLILGLHWLAEAKHWLDRPGTWKIIPQTFTEAWTCSSIIGAAMLVIHAMVSAKAFEGKPADIAVGDLVRAPDYDANLGFVHQVAEDLREALKLIPTSMRPMIVFIDDLDRCSPNNVSDVVEAVNLFLAGEFPHCMFVLGIDDEVVAAALSKAHGDIFSRMPSYTKTTSIGWRFMDKFIQLPFIMPPPDKEKMITYARSLLLDQSGRGKLTMETRVAVTRSVEHESAPRRPEEIVNAVRVQNTQPLGSAATEELRREAETIQLMDQNIRSFSDEEESIAKLILGSIGSYSRNPRDIKRFVNSFRFYYFLRAARISLGQETPSLEQMSRWILLSLRWPGILRWLRSAGTSAQDSTAKELEAIECTAKDAADVQSWVTGAGNQMELKPEESSWLHDDEMLAFFRSESELPKPERLSASVGKGLW